MLACKFHFIFYFYLPLKTCNFNYSNLLLLINISVGKRHCNHQLQPHQWYLLKLTNYIKAKCLYEVIFFLYSIGYFDHSVHSRPHPHTTPRFLLEGWAFYQILKNGCSTGSQFLMGIAGKKQSDFFQGGRGLQFLHKKN